MTIRRKETVDGNKVIVRKFDENGTKRKATIANGEDFSTTVRSFDENGNKTKAVITKQDGTKIVRRFDEDGNKTKATVFRPEGDKTVRRFDENGDRTRATDFDKDGNKTQIRLFENNTLAKTINLMDDAIKPEPLPTAPPPAENVAPIYNPFNLSREQAGNLINTTDGVQAYDPSTGWGGFPQRQGSEDVIWNAGLSENLSDPNPGSYVKGAQNGGIDANESTLMANQAQWAAEQAPQQGMASSQTATGARNFLTSLFNGSTYPAAEQGQMSAGIDVDGDNKFTMNDYNGLEMLDGQQGLSNRDFDIATTRAIMDQ